MKKLIFTLTLSLSLCVVLAQSESAGANNGAKSPSFPENVKPMPNPASTGVMDIGEGFDDISTLPGSGWYAVNLSNPLGVTNWFQGNYTVFPAYDGDPVAYIGANYNNTAGAGTISNWLLTPVQSLQNGDVMTFYTRTVQNASFPDRLQVRLSINGASTDVGTSETSVGDFNILLLDINPTYIIGGFPEAWTQYSVTITGLSGTESGRFAFRYFVEDGGPYGNNSDYFGIDRVEFTETVLPPFETPVSNWAIAIGIGLILTFVVFRYRRF